MAESSPLMTIQDWFQSPNPRDRAKGVAGKLAVEAGGAVVVVSVLATIVGGILAALPPVAMPSPTVGTGTALLGCVVYIERRVWCTIIRDRDESA